ncbi:MAG: restriction endonuclease [Ardenticatenaceae bacterium]|nr:restriction endonuclease [Ardenticatenaceae bacterium]MCB9445711.1 restriction endonuclease [Ardenticatenaceae bacterium]
MIIRIESQFSHPRRIIQSLQRTKPAPKTAVIQGWIIIAGLTTLFALWMIYHAWWQPTWLTNLPDAATELLNLMEAAGAFTLGFLWMLLWWRRKRPYQPAIITEITNLQVLSPGDFEKYVGQLFRQKGYRVKLRGSKGDLGVDLELTRADGKQAIVQCKRYHNTVGPKIVRELYGTLIHEQAAHAFLVTTADISDAAREWAQFKPLTLIDGETLIKIAASLAESRSKGK